MRHAAVLSDLELSILGLIHAESRSGYDLRKELQASPGAIYPAVKRLAAAGLIAGKPMTGARKKESFHLTAAGRRTLKEGLGRPVIEEVRRDPQAVAARLRFLEGAAAREFLEEYARLAAICAEELERQAGLAARHDAALYAARVAIANELIRDA